MFFAKCVYRLLKPFLRRVMPRVRSYFMDEASSIISRKITQEISHQTSLILPRLDKLEEISGVMSSRVSVNCGEDEVLVKTQVGYMLCSSKDHALLSCLLDRGELEHGTSVFIQKFLKPCDVYIDVGANIGMHVLAAARRMKGQGKIIAFEPFEKTKFLLDKSLIINGFTNVVEVHQIALSNTQGVRKLFLGKISAHNSLFELGILSDNDQWVEVRMDTLDSVVGSQKVDLIKIDAEGAEIEIIEGGKSLILGNPNVALIVEFGSYHLHRMGYSTDKWLSVFTDLGLVWRIINEATGELEMCSLHKLEQFESVNLFFARAESEVWNRL